MAKDIKILILSCGTGGGHNSAALAVKENLIDKGIKADFVEYLGIINNKLKNGVNKLYIKTTKRQGKIFKQVYKLGELYRKTNLVSPVYGLNSLNKKKLYNYIQKNEYNYVITTHLFAAQALTAIKKEHNIKFVAIATDYTCIPFWEETNPDYFIIPSADLIDDFTKRGISKEKLLPYGIPVSKAYKNPEKKETAKLKLGLKKDKKYILILTGSMGFGNSTKMIKELKKEINNAIFIVSCGNNKKMLESIKQEYRDTDRVIALPYVKNLDEYMKASEIVLTKPGGLTTTEVATAIKPMIHTMPIPGCENYNAEYFSNRKMSIKCDTLNDVVENTKILIKNKELQNELMQNQEKYIHRDTCDKISELIIKELEK